MKILIVDDHEEDRYMLETLLRGHGYEVESAADGVEALEKISQNGFDMIITDILMPRMDGFQFCRKVKESEGLKKIALVFYTSTYTDPKDEEFALNLGAEKFIIKPTEPDVFIRILKEVVENCKAGTLGTPRSSIKEEAVYLKEYNERLIKKLEDKLLDLERTNKSLKESEKKYKELIDNANDAVVVIEKTGYINFVNPRFCEMTGYSVDEAKKLHFSKLIHPDDLNMVTEYFRKKLVGEKVPRNYEARVLTKAGKTIHIDNNTSIIEREGEIVGVLSVVRDITRRKQVEDALWESEAHLREAQRVAHLGNWDWNIGKNELFWSDETYRIFGLTPQEFKPSYDAFLNFIHPHDRECVKKSVDEALSEKKPYSVDHRIVLPDGSERVVHERAEVFFDENGDPIRMMGTVQDITERKQAEKQIEEYSKNLERMVEERTRELNRALYATEEARDKIDGILKSIADGLIVTDKYNNVVLMNRAAEDLLGIRFCEIIGRPIDFAIEEKTLREKLIDTLSKKKTGYEFDFKLPSDNPDCSRIMRARTSVIHDKQDRETGIVTIIHDVTRERELDRMKTEFLSTAAHELRSPLTSIQGFSEILQTREDLSEEEKKKFLSYINNQSVALAKIINDLLDISRLESGLGFSLNKVSCNVGDIIKEVVLFFQEYAPEHNFEMVLPGEPVELTVDEDKIEEVLKNILSNAVKYSPEGGVIRLVGEVVEGHYQVSVEDQGIGMTSEQVERVFDKFYRVDSSDTAVEGTGLGMSIVKYIVEAHGGRVWVESELGKGTTVRFRIPLES